MRMFCFCILTTEPIFSLPQLIMGSVWIGSHQLAYKISPENIQTIALEFLFFILLTFEIRLLISYFEWNWSNFVQFFKKSEFIEPLTSSCSLDVELSFKHNSLLCKKSSVYNYFVLHPIFSLKTFGHFAVFTLKWSK